MTTPMFCAGNYENLLICTMTSSLSNMTWTTSDSLTTSLQPLSTTDAEDVVQIFDVKKSQYGLLYHHHHQFIIARTEAGP